MAYNFGNNINYYLSMPSQHRELLFQIRKWNNLKILEDNNTIWVKDFTYEQINSIEVKSLPHKKMFYENQNQLYLLESLLPDCNLPDGLWTNIDWVLKIELPSQNFNYFEKEEKLDIRLKPSFEEKEESALLVNLNDFILELPYISSARLLPLKWSIIGEYAFIIGQPILPLKGQSYWIDEGLCLPSGYDVQHISIKNIIKNVRSKSSYDYFLWIGDSIIRINNKDFKQCSISSFQRTLHKN
jgi:hypothetical protein